LRRTVFVVAARDVREHERSVARVFPEDDGLAHGQIVMGRQSEGDVRARGLGYGGIDFDISVVSARAGGGDGDAGAGVE